MRKLIGCLAVVVFVSAASVAEAQYQYGGLAVQTGFGTYGGYGNWAGGGYVPPRYPSYNYYQYQYYPTPSYGYGRSGPYGYYYQRSPSGFSYWNGYGGGSVDYNPRYSGRRW